MPVNLLHGDLHAVIVWYAALFSGVFDSESRFVNLSEWPRLTTGSRPLFARSPRAYVNSWMFTLFVGGPDSIEVGFGRPPSDPPWLRFSARGPCVRRQVASMPLVNGSFPSAV